MGVSRLANYALRYYVDAILITPTIALAPIFVILFGITSTNVLVLTVLYGYAIIAISTAVAVRGVDPTLLEVGRVYGAGRLRLAFGFLIPAAMPSLFGGLHLGVTRAFKGMVVGQVFLGVLGVGGFVARYSQAFDAAGVWCIAIVLIALALLITWFVKAADHVINYWAYRV
jgi:NitT/TauT family transport system permease protein